MTFLAENREGRLRPACARYIAISGNNFVSNTWRPDSQATVGDASLRTLLGFVGRMSSNAFQEFWPDVRQRFSWQSLKASTATKVLPTAKNLPTSEEQAECWFIFLEQW